MSLALRFGRSAAVAAPSARQVERFGNVSRIDDARARAAGRAQVGRGGRGTVGFSPRDSARAGRESARAGADNCPTQHPPGSFQAWCYEQGETVLPIGTGIVSIPAFANGVNGQGTLTLTPVEAFTLADIEVTDPSGQILFSSIKIGRCDFIEAGLVSSQRYAPNGTGCKMFEGKNIYPNSGMIFQAQNPTLAPVVLSVTGSGIPIPCNTGGKPS